jgi:anti-sigma factor RsiW
MKNLLEMVLHRRDRECEQVRALMSDYVDSELHADAKRRVDDHVGMCPRCRRVLANLRYTLERVRGLADRTPPGAEDEAAVTERIQAAWRQQI